MKKVDWCQLATDLETICQTRGGWTERGGTDVAKRALIEILGEDVLVNAVDHAVTLAPGSELAVSVLSLLQPRAAMARCIEVFRTSTDPETAAGAIWLLQRIADRSAVEWLPEVLSSPNALVRAWGIGIVDHLLIAQGVIELHEAEPFIEAGLRDAEETVRERAKQVLEMIEHEEMVEKRRLGQAS
ncbi:HEAT repeat domain-containing protein [Sphingomonas sp. R647]|uniref:HEAT repeat domain-containing protein n=1 Tax=Sphingomonas sp. R647 TaxID=2875233 RepID=UPI001CD38B03|nr:HEAT repeat domain-containing protein [Sphingomonas sp. R647]MCA1197234.1 HEAT repeat domain-containing protein [Sphingomonas sp. R647]